MPRTQGDADFPAAVRSAASRELYYQLTPVERRKVERRDKRGVFGRGCAGDSKIDKALEQFKATNHGKPAVNRRVQQMTRKAYLKLALRWFSRCQTDCGSVRERISPMTQANWDEAARILGTPKKSGAEKRKVRYWRTVESALANHPQKRRLSQLVRKSKLSDAGFGNKVLKMCPKLLKLGKIDIRDTFPKATLDERKAAADIWNGNTPWLTVVRGTARPFDPARDDVNVRRAGKTYVYWDKHGEDYYRYFTFMFDATTMSNKDGGAKRTEKGFISLEEAHPPECGVASKHLNTQDSVMWYEVIHAFGGHVSGPDIMHWGTSRTTRGKRDGRHAAWLRTWCGSRDAACMLGKSRDCASTPQWIGKHLMMGSVQVL